MADNYKGQLKEHCDQVREINLEPVYETNRKPGTPDHRPLYVSTVSIPQVGIFEGEASFTIIGAQHSAAKKAMQSLEIPLADDPLVNEEPSAPNYVGLLQEFCVANELIVERYNIRQSGGQPHSPIFEARVIVDGNTFTASYNGRKQDAKHVVAKKALDEIGRRYGHRLFGLRQVIDQESFRSLKENLSNRADTIDSGPARSQLNEYCQQFNIDCPQVESDPVGPPWLVAVIVGGRRFYGYKNNKKEAEHQASYHAYLWLRKCHHTSLDDCMKIDISLDVDFHEPQSLFMDAAVLACHKLYSKLCLNSGQPESSSDVVAAFILYSQMAKSCQIVGLASGSKIITSEHQMDDGTVLIDCHAEVLARRTFLHFLYSQIQVRESEFLESSEDGLLQLKADIKVILYISKPPCGDGTVFTRTASRGRFVDRADNHERRLNRYGADSRDVGSLRKKVERGEGQILGNIPDGRFMVNCCSDKILKWNCVGLQGALLSQLLKPVYLSAVVIGDRELFHHGHITRAICCRLPDFVSVHPSLHVVSEDCTHNMRSAHTDNTSETSLNWIIGMNEAEVVIPIKGLQKNDRPSRLCKKSLFSQFKQAYKRCHGNFRPDMETYIETKMMAKQYQSNKLTFYKGCSNINGSVWVKNKGPINA